jgi:predicted enzyme related to lactoylglutathione lyase
VGIGSDLIRKDWVQTENFAAITELTAKCLAWSLSARGFKVFTGVEHVGIYPQPGAKGMETAEWYKSTFDFDIKEGHSSIFVQGAGQGRIEIAKTDTSPHNHIAISVSNFEAASEVLKARGIEVEAPIIKSTSKAVYLKQTDPAGNRVHLLWRK